MTISVAPDVWTELEAGRGWTPARVLFLRTACTPAGATEPMPREDFGALVGASERSVYRWEHGIVKALTTMAGRSLAQLAKTRLSPAQLVELCQVE